jgi:hypothetical protein
LVRVAPTFFAPLWLGHRRVPRRNQPAVEQSLDFIAIYPIRQDLGGFVP